MVLHFFEKSSSDGKTSNYKTVSGTAVGRQSWLTKFPRQREI